DYVLDFFDLVGLEVARGVVEPELVWHELYYPIAPYVQLTRQRVAEVRRDNPSVWEDLVILVPKLYTVETPQGHLSTTGLTADALVELLDDEQRVGAEGSAGAAPRGPRRRH